MTNENAINFLLYSYFELTLDSGENEILDAAAERAYRDASGRVLSIANESESGKYKGNAKEKLNSQLLKLPPAADYDTWFFETCCELKTAYKTAENKDGDHAFHFGHAQKWVNMTMKYLYVIKSIFKVYGKDILPWLTDDLEERLHIPVDSYIMEAAAAKGTISCKKQKVNFPYGLGLSLPGNNGDKDEGEGKKPVPYSSAKAWSKWEKADYETFYKKLREKVKLSEKSPLDWEGPAWIEMAKIRKNREKKQ